MFKLLLLAWHLVTLGQLAPEMASRFVSDVAIATFEAGASLEDAALLETWAGFESKGVPDALGDSGRSCGATQLGLVARRGHSCAEVRADRVLAMRLWLENLATLRVREGSTERALSVLSCGKPDGARELVAIRCFIARSPR